MILYALAGFLVASALPEDELKARRTWFDATIVRSALEPCKVAVPAQADAFERHAANWLQANEVTIRRGEASFRAEAGDAFRPEEFDIEGARRQFTGLLEGYTEERKRVWCEEQLQLRLSPDDAS